MERAAVTPRTSSRRSMELTRALLNAAVVAGPFYVLLGLVQAIIRPGFDWTRHDLSLLSNGQLGWIQIANFMVTGVLVLVGAVGMRRALRGSRGGTWAPLLIGLYGLGLVAAGIFVADPMNGFPPGTPAGPPTQPSGHGFLHILSGAVGFIGLIAACFVFARRYAAAHQPGWAAFSAITGVLFLAAFFGIAAGSQQGGAILVVVTVAFTAAVVLAWTWLSLTASRLIAQLPNPDSGGKK